LLLAVFIALLSVSSFASEVEPEAEYEGDGGDWVAVDLEGLLQDIEEILGYIPKISLSQGETGEYGTILFLLPSGTIQKMVHYDLQNKHVMMSYNDITMLLYGKELEEYVFPFKGVTVKFTCDPEKKGEFCSPYVKGNIIQVQESLFFYIEDKTSSIRLPRYESMAAEEGIEYFIHGRDIAQAIYDLSMLPK